MPDKAQATPNHVRPQEADEIATIIGTRCECCGAPCWPIHAPCRYCESIAAAEARLREVRRQAAPDESAYLRWVRDEALRQCSGSRAEPYPAQDCGNVVCVPCSARRLLNRRGGNR